MGGFFSPITTNPVITDNWGGDSQPKRPGLFSRLLGTKPNPLLSGPPTEPSKGPSLIDPGTSVDVHGGAAPKVPTETSSLAGSLPQDDISLPEKVRQLRTQSMPPQLKELMMDPAWHASHTEPDQPTRMAPQSEEPDPYERQMLSSNKALADEYARATAPPQPSKFEQHHPRLAEFIKIGSRVAPLAIGATVGGLTGVGFAAGGEAQALGESREQQLREREEKAREVASLREAMMRGQGELANYEQRKASLWSEPVEMTDANGNPVMVQVNKATGVPRPVQGYGPKPLVPKEGDLPLSAQQIGQLNQTLRGRFQVLNPGKPLPPEYLLPTNATQKDYDRIDKQLEGTERATGTLLQQQQVTELRKQGQAAAQAARAQADQDRSDKRKERQSQAVYATDPQTGVTRMMREQEALDAGLMYEKVSPKQVSEDRQLTTRLSDVQQKISRYQDAFKTPITTTDVAKLSAILSDDKLKLGVNGISLPVDWANKLLKAGAQAGLSPQAQKLLIAYANARESMVGYQRVLSGSGRSNEKSLELQLETLPTPLNPADYANEGFSQFQENLRIVGQGLPQLPGVQRPEEIEQNFSAPQRQTGGAGPKLSPAGQRYLNSILGAGH